MSRGAPANMYDERGRAPDRAYAAARAYSAARRSRIVGMTPGRIARLTALGVCVALQCGLLLVSLTPQTTWAEFGFPDGPIPAALSPLVAGLFYILPTATGALSRRWQIGLVLPPSPAWLDLGASPTS